jgi:hypothetical protein
LPRSDGAFDRAPRLTVVSAITKSTLRCHFVDIGKNRFYTLVIEKLKFTHSRRIEE